MSNQNRKFEGVWIEKEVWASKSLTLQEKCFFVEIKSLDNKDGCFATNEYFSDFFQISKRRCISVINSLDEKGLINKKLIYKKGTKQVEKRVLRVSNTWRKKLHHPSEESFTTPHEENDMTPVKEVSPPSCQNVHDPGEGMFTDNSTSNSTSNSTIERENAHAKNPEKNPKKEKPELTAESTQPSKKIAPKKVSEPVHENDFPKDDSELTVENMVAIPEPSEVADGMFNYYTIGDGSGTLSMILSSLNIDSIHQIDFKKVCVGWALKYSDEPFTLRDWKNKSRKSLLNWIANEHRSNKFNQAKIKSLNNGKKRSSTDPLITAEEMEQAYRELLAEGYR